MDILTQKLKSATDAVLRNSEVCTKEIELVAESARTLFNLNSVLVVTNRDYRYQLTPLFVASKNSKEQEKVKDVPLTVAQYANMVRLFKEDPMHDGPMSGWEVATGDRLLRYGVLHADHYYGHVIFAAEAPHEFSPEEKEAICEIGQLMLMYFGMCHLREGAPKYNWEEEKIGDKNVLAAFFVDVEDDECHALKEGPFLKNMINEWMPYTRLLEVYSKKYMEPAYADGLRWKFGLENLRATLSMECPVLTMEFPHIEKDAIVWIRCIADLAEPDFDGKALKVHLTMRDITERKRRELELEEISSHLEKE